MIFDIDTEMVLQGVIESLETAAAQTTEEQFNKIANSINDALPGVIQVLAQGISEYWKSEARSAGGWGTKYAKAIQYEVSGTKAEIYLDEDMVDPGSKKPYFMFAMNMERGVKSWSIKKALLASDKAKTSADGIKYIVVPFPVSTPRKASQGKMQNKFGKREMTRAMHGIVKSGGKLPTGSTIKAGGRDVDISGLTRYNTRQFHSQYGIFIAVNQDSKGWQYPDVPAEPVYPSVLAGVNNQIREMLTEFSKEIVKEHSD
jgi:hypothetical protein